MALGLLEAGLGLGQAAIGMFGMGKKRRAAQSTIDALETYNPNQEILGEYSAAKTRATGGLGGAAKAAYQQGTQQAVATTLDAATNRKAALAAAGMAGGQLMKAAMELGTKEEAAQRANEATRRQMASAVAGEKEKAFKSRQQKQQLKANIALQELASQGAMISQGLGAVGGGLTAGALGGEKLNLSGLGKLGKGVLGLFGKKKTATPIDLSDYQPTDTSFLKKQYVAPTQPY